MPIGKNAIKRVTNNGSSNVKSSAPDMESSVVAEETKIAPKKKATATAAPKASRKPSVSKAVSAPKKSMESEPTLAPTKTLERVMEKSTESPKRQGEGYINLGGELPYYLL